ncbi:hypothetical protein [Litoribrevibacter albus]|uniref:Uncharacterized protein n=1 Tax=Litoribrevibacter albus TaxID=1473156 RepID=A0AA37SCR6_9GAMM|nr:hypothetical protein [Litoribrevibacter albus]GLQ33675.1 hypothetical protein GCM10007876_41550 [Litoribrevibacter albus]
MIVSTSSLALAKYTLSQWSLVNYYERYYEKQRALRQLDKQLTALLLKEENYNESCLSDSDKYTSCSFMPLDNNVWGLYGRSLDEAEVQSIESQWFGSEDIISPIHWVCFELRNTGDSTVVSTFLYRRSVSQLSEALTVSRELVWPRL